MDDKKRTMISIIVPCKNRLKHLKQTLWKMLNQTYKDIEVIVVDMNCPNNTYKWVKHRFKDNVKVVKMDVPVNYWNLCESRNYGYKHSNGDVLLFLDADTVLNLYFLERTLPLEGFMTGIMGEIQDNEIVYNCCGCLMVYRKDFEAVKGYNEYLEGWGFDDFDIRNRLEAIGLKRKVFDMSLIKALGHSIKSRNQYHGGQSLHETNAKNHEISKHKFKGI